MFALCNTNELSANRIISRHRTLEAVARAHDKLQRDTKRNNGESSYTPTCVRKIVDGQLVCLNDSEMDDYEYAQQKVHCD